MAADTSIPALATVDAVIIVGFLVLVTVVGYVMSRMASRGLDDYFLGGNKIPWWVLGISTSTSNFDMAGTMIIVAVVFSLGLKGFLVEIRGGVGLTLAFVLVFLAKWLRRSRVMTSAEWMKLRFGTDRQGQAAHLLSAIANIVLSLGMIVYFCKGAGSFLTHFLPFSELTCTTVMVLIGLFYTLMSGLYGVVFTDVIQMILLSFTAIYISVVAFGMKEGVVLPEGFLSLDLSAPTTPGAAALIAKDPATWEPIMNMFGICVIMWFVRSTLEGCGGVGGYTDQRFLAARNEREAGLLTLEAIVLSVVRWTMVAGIVVMGYHLVQTGGAGAEIIAADPEQVLPVVLSRMLPVGIKGLVVAGLIAAAMSTFDSTLNAGASYVVKDIYESYVNPEASNHELLRMSRWATVGLCVVGVSLAALVPNINQIWGLLTMGLGAGLFVPSFLRWYWPGFTGYGYAGGTAVGMITGLLFKSALQWPLYVSFPATLGSALVASVVISLLTSRASDDVLLRFYVQTNPWGFWQKFTRLAVDREILSEDATNARLWEKINDAIAVCLSVPFQLSMLLGGMALMFHDWEKFALFTLFSGLSGIGLYFFWYKNLKSEEECAADDAYFASQQSAIQESFRARP